MPAAKYTRKQVANNLVGRVFLEAAEREMQKRKLENYPSFHEWLPLVTPTWNWNYPHLIYIQKHLQAIAEGKLKKLMVFLPPQHGKSEQGTIRFPAYLLERDPSKRILIASYGADLAETFSRKARSIVRSRGMVPINTERSAVHNWVTKAGGGVKAAGVGGPITGYGFNLFLMDDVIKGREEAESKSIRETAWKWYTDDLKTRSQLNSQFVFTCTRWHEDDLPARILAKENDWTVIRLPALCEGNDPADYPQVRELGDPLCPELHSLEQLLEFKQTMGQSFYSLYQGNPTPMEGTVWKRAWFCEDGDIKKPLRTVSKFPQGARLTQVWDTALEKGERNDNTAMVEGCFMDGIIFVSAKVNKQLDFPELIKEMKAQRDRGTKNSIPPEVGTEDKANGKASCQQLRTEGIPIIEIPAGTHDKTARAKSVTHYAESGMVVLVNDTGNCNDELVNQLFGFDQARYDDLHDAFVHLLRRVVAGSQRWSKGKLKEIGASLQ